MQYRMIAVAMPLFVASSIAAYGQATVKNSCGDPAYFWACGDVDGERVIIAPGGSHSEPYAAKNGGGGYSYKIATNHPDTGIAPKSIYDLPQPNITQFEVTIGSPGPPANMVWYDISNVNGYPFVAGGVDLTSSDGSVNASCPKGVLYCQAAYNAPHDDHATGSADEEVDLIMELCAGVPGIMAAGGSSSSSSGSGSSGGSSDSESSAAPVASSAPAATQAAPQVQQKQVSNPQHQQQHQQEQQQHQQEQQHQGQPQVNEKVTEHAAVPSPTTTPAPTTPDEDVVVVWVTHTAEPEVVTVHVDGSKAKRDQHVHQHVHNKINKKRHGGA